MEHRTVFRTWLFVLCLSFNIPTAAAEREFQEFEEYAQTIIAEGNATKIVSLLRMGQLTPSNGLVNAALRRLSEMSDPALCDGYDALLVGLMAQRVFETALTRASEAVARCPSRELSYVVLADSVGNNASLCRQAAGWTRPAALEERALYTALVSLAAARLACGRPVEASLFDEVVGLRLRISRAETLPREYVSSIVAVDIASRAKADDVVERELISALKAICALESGRELVAGFVDPDPTIARVGLDTVGLVNALRAARVITRMAEEQRRCVHDLLARAWEVQGEHSTSAGDWKMLLRELGYDEDPDVQVP